jgi:hypothetical protein
MAGTEEVDAEDSRWAEAAHVRQLEGVKWRAVRPVVSIVPDRREAVSNCSAGEE